MRGLPTVLLSLALLWLHTTCQMSGGETKAASDERPVIIEALNKTANTTFDYPAEISQLTAVFRTEVPSAARRVFFYDITAATTNCTVEMGLFISEVLEASNTAKLSGTLRVTDPKGERVTKVGFNTAAKRQRTVTLHLNAVGKYRFELRNRETVAYVVDLVLGLTDCHSIPHKLHEQDLVVVANRFQAGLMTQTVGLAVPSQRELQDALQREAEVGGESRRGPPQAALRQSARVHPHRAALPLPNRVLAPRARAEAGHLVSPSIALNAPRFAIAKRVFVLLSVALVINSDQF